MAANEGSMGSSNIANQTSNSTGPNIGGTNKKTKVVKDAIAKGKTITGKTPDTIILNPVMEAKEKTAVMTYGRFNPPTIGHEKLIHKVESVAAEHNGTPHIIASHTEGNSKNPLPADKKVGYLKKVASKGTHVSSSSKEHPSFLHQAKKLHDAGYHHLVMVAGSDRVDEYHKKLHQYNGKEGHYNFKSIKVVSAGHRDPDAEGAEGMSGTKLREHARSGNMKAFKSGLPKSLHPHAEEIANHIKSVKESADDIFNSFILETALDEICSVYDAVMLNLQEDMDKNNTHHRDEGTSSLVDIYKDDTPGEPKKKLNKKFEEAFKATDREAVMRSGQDRKKEDLVSRSDQDRKQTTNAYRQQEIQKKIIDEQFADTFEAYGKGYKSPWDKIEKAKPGIGARIDNHVKDLDDLNKKYQDILDREKAAKAKIKTNESINSAGGGAVRGMGVNSGNPDGETPNHVSSNIASADTQNDLLKKFKKQFHDDQHINVQKEEYQTPVTKKNFGKTEHYQALDDLDLNTANRNHTIDEYGYGPLNPDDESGSAMFWKEKSELWNTSVEAARTARCGNCAAFNQTEAIMKKIYDGLGPEGKKINQLADLGFCEIFEFKCAAARTCDAWLRNGPIKEDVNEDLRQWFKDKWVRMDTKGNIKGDCAREPGEGKPKCLPLAQARAMDKEDRATAARRKRREDPVADRSGKGSAPINVRTEAANPAQQAAIAIALIKAGKKKGKMPKPQNEELEETKSAPKGFHFTRDGKLRRGDADRDGDGGTMLRSDPLDKQRNKIPQVSEEILNEKNKPTKPELWSRAKSLAKSKFDVYPSAYANGWAAKWYKKHGGSWRSE